MTDKYSDNPPKKGDWILNPKTKRMIRVGNKQWLKLVKEGIIQGHYRDPDHLADTNDMTEEETQLRKKELNKTLPPHKQAVKGRGKHKNKLVVREKPLNPVDVSNYTAQMATNAVKKNIKKLAVAQTDKELEQMLEKMVMQEMMEYQSLKKPKLTRQKGFYKVKKNKDEDYEDEMTVPEQDSEEDEDF